MVKKTCLIHTKKSGSPLQKRKVQEGEKEKKKKMAGRGPVTPHHQTTYKIFLNPTLFKVSVSVAIESFFFPLLLSYFFKNQTF
jgi:hypothetical protein